MTYYYMTLHVNTHSFLQKKKKNIIESRWSMNWMKHTVQLLRFLIRQFNDATRPAKQVTFFDAEAIISGWECTTDLTPDPLLRLINWSTFGGDTEDRSLSANPTVFPDVTSTTAIPATNQKQSISILVINQNSIIFIIYQRK